MANPSSKKSALPAAPNRRAVLAFIALADAPMPREVEFRVHPDPQIGDCLDLRFETAADLLAWSKLLGCDQRWNRRHLHGDTWINSGGDASKMNGWVVMLTAYEKAESAEIDDETRAGLNALVQS